jgi:hypothetical protein
MDRPGEILSALLDVLSDWSGPCDEAIIHAQINNRVQPKIELSEFRHALAKAKAEGWIDQVSSARRGTLWTITHKGEAERIK